MNKEATALGMIELPYCFAVAVVVLQAPPASNCVTLACLCGCI